MSRARTARRAAERAARRAAPRLRFIRDDSELTAGHKRCLATVEQALAMGERPLPDPAILAIEKRTPQGFQCWAGGSVVDEVRAWLLTRGHTASVGALDAAVEVARGLSWAGAPTVLIDANGCAAILVVEVGHTEVNAPGGVS